MLQYSSSMTENFHHLLLTYLQDSAVFYLDQRASGKNKQQASSLEPKVGDFETYKDSSNRLRFGIIEKVGLGSNKCVVVMRAVKHGRPVEQ